MSDDLRPDWSYKKLNELGFVGRGRSRHRPRNEPSLYSGPYPFFQTGDVKAADLYLSSHSQTYSEKGLAQSKLWEPGTLCITIAANIAETAILKVRGCFPDSIVGFVADSEKADVRFVKYAIDTMKLRMQSISRGTTQDNLSLDKLLTFGVPTPPLPTQRKIAAILSAYDDLIENNTRRVAALEEMARLLYREWFVHFRFPGHEQVAMVDSELGPIPEGWGVVRVKSVVKRLKAGRTYRKAEVSKTGRVSVIDQSRDTVLGFHNSDPDHQATPEVPIIIFGDHTSKMQLMVEPFSVGPNVVPFVSQNDIPIAFLYFLVNNLVETREYKRHWTELMNKQVVLAPNAHTKQFAIFARPIFAQTDSLTRRNMLLRRTRDLLLPRLISGEVDVSDMAIDTGGIER